MKLKWCCLALALLFLLPACSRQAKDDAYHWVPPEKKITQTAVDDGYDPASGMTYEEYLTTLDEPIVVSMKKSAHPGILVLFFGSAPVLNPADDFAPSFLSMLNNSPHVTKVSFPTLLHWLDNFAGEQIMQFPEEYIDHGGIDFENVRFAPMEKATLMIGQYQSALKEEQIGEGRKWEDMRECCVNRALYEKMLADEAMEFSGLGDSITVTETCYRRGINPESKKEAIGVHHDLAITKHEYTVVGIVEDEGEYANTDAYGFFHIYAPLDMVKNLTAKHDYNHPSYVDEAMYLVSQIMHQNEVDVSGIYFRPTADDPTKKELRLPGNRIIPEEEWLEIWDNVPVNAGFRIEITLDSGTGFAELLEYFNGMAEERPAQFYYDYQYKVYEMNKENNKNNPNWVDAVNMPQILEEIAADGELDDWFYYPLVPRVVRPLRVAGG